MSWKFPLYRCDECGAVWFDPPTDDEDERAPRRCNIVYECDGGAVAACGGRVEWFALLDSDVFITLRR